MQQTRPTAKPHRLLATILMFAAFGCFIAAFVELPEHTLHATLWIVAGAALWMVEEVTGR